MCCFVPSDASDPFYKCAFIDDSSVSVITRSFKLRSFVTADPALSPAAIDLPPESPIVFFKRVGKYLFALGAQGSISYVQSDFSRLKIRHLDLPAPIIDARDAGDSLFILLANGQLGAIRQNDFGYLPIASAAKFAVDHRGDYVHICLPTGEWQLWSLRPVEPLFGLAAGLKCDFSVWSPIVQTIVFFSENVIVVTYWSTEIERHVLPESASLAAFDTLGQHLLFAAGASLYAVGVATTSWERTGCSAPITSRAVLLPFREMLYSIPLPKGVRGKMSLFGEAALAVASSSAVCVLRFGTRIHSGLLDGSPSQFIKNSGLLNEREIPDWAVIDNVAPRALAWFGAQLVVLSFQRELRVDVIAGDRVNYSIPLKERPVSISVSGTKLLIAYETQFSLFSLENGGKLISTQSFGQLTARQVSFLNSETIAVHTIDRKLLFIFRSQVLHVFEDVLGFHFTGSTAWPMLLFGSKWRLLGANNAELFLGEEINRGLFIGVDGFSLFSIAPFRLVDFVHLVVGQSLSSDSIASAVSILVQSHTERRLGILIKVGRTVSDALLPTFMALLDRFSPIEDQVLFEVLGVRKFRFDKREFWAAALARGWYRAASLLLSADDLSLCIDLIVKSNFDVNVVQKGQSLFPSLFEADSRLFENADWWRMEEELVNFLREKVFKFDFIAICRLLPFFQDAVRRFLLKTRREREITMTQFGKICDGMRRCSRQQLIEFAGIFEDVLAFNLLFCASYCLQNFGKCIECIERQQRMTRAIDPAVLLAVGYSQQ
jgi:hypothetical protein